MRLFLSFVALATLAAQTQQKTFDTPDAAAQALIGAASSNDTAALKAIFGPKGAAILTSGDAAQDQAERDEFVTIARRKYQLQRDSMNPDRMLLSIGEDDWPFPVPIVKAGGKWRFDTAMGATMMQARRVGADELDVIEICTGYATAEKEYAEQHAGAGYARRMLSTPGKDDGLYSDAHPRVPTRFAESVEDGISNAKPKRYHGYYFKVLTAQGSGAPGGRHNYLVKNELLGGFALVAWPAEFGVTGIHTFLVNQDGVVYEGRPTRPANPLQAPVAQFNPGPDWKPVD